jgi:hypothetical protein
MFYSIFLWPIDHRDLLKDSYLVKAECQSSILEGLNP